MPVITFHKMTCIPCFNSVKSIGYKLLNIQGSFGSEVFQLSVTSNIAKEIVRNY